MDERLITWPARLAHWPIVFDVRLVGFQFCLRAKDTEVGAPRADRLSVVLFGDACHLEHMREVVRDPRRNQLAERDGAELGMNAGLVESVVANRPGVERLQARGPLLGEQVEQPRRRLAAVGGKSLLTI